jgi:hypothetical protein
VAEKNIVYIVKVSFIYYSLASVNSIIFAQPYNFAFQKSVSDGFSASELILGIMLLPSSNAYLGQAECNCIV